MACAAGLEGLKRLGHLEKELGGLEQAMSCNPCRKAALLDKSDQLYNDIKSLGKSDCSCKYLNHPSRALIQALSADTSWF